MCQPRLVRYVHPLLSGGSDIGYYPVKNYRRGIADFFGVILLKRRRSVHFMGVTRPRNGRGRPFLDYIYICIRTIYTY